MRNVLLYRHGRWLVAALALVLLSGCSALDQMKQRQYCFNDLGEADRLYSIGQNQQAHQWVDKALALFPHSSVPFIGDDEKNAVISPNGIVGIMQNRGRYQELADCLTKAVADPALKSNPFLYMALGDAETHLDQPALAMAAYKNELAAWKTPLVKGATVETGSPFLLLKADAEWNSGDQAQATRDYETVIRTDTENTGMLAANNLAYNMSLNKTDLPRALSLANEAVQAARDLGDDETTGTFLDTQAWVEHQSGDDASAVADEQEAVSLTPLQGDVRFHLAEIYRALGRKEEAQQEYERALTLNPYNKEAASGLTAVGGSPSAVLSAAPGDSVT